MEEKKTIKQNVILLEVKFESSINGVVNKISDGGTVPLSSSDSL